MGKTRPPLRPPLPRHRSARHLSRPYQQSRRHLPCPRHQQRERPRYQQPKRPLWSPRCRQTKPLRPRSPPPHRHHPNDCHKPRAKRPNMQRRRLVEEAPWFPEDCHGSANPERFRRPSRVRFCIPMEYKNPRHNAHPATCPIGFPINSSHVTFPCRIPDKHLSNDHLHASDATVKATSHNVEALSDFRQHLSNAHLHASDTTSRDAEATPRDARPCRISDKLPVQRGIHPARREST